MKREAIAAPKTPANKYNIYGKFDDDKYERLVTTPMNDENSMRSLFDKKGLLRNNMNIT